MDKKIFFGIAVGLVLITSGFLVWQLWYTPTTSDNDDGALIPCSDIQDQLLKDDCYWNEAIQKKDSSICNKVQNQETIDNCYYSYVASLNKDVSICDNMQDQTRKDECYWLIAVSKKDQVVCANIQEEEKKWDCERFAYNPNAEEALGRMNAGLSLDTLNMLNWKTYTNDTFSIKYPENVLIMENGSRTEFSSKERGEHFDAGGGLRRDISRDYMVIAATQKECDMQKESFEIEKCEFGTTTPIMYFKIETISNPIEEVVDEVIFNNRGDISLIDSAKYGLNGKAYYQYPKGFEGTGYGYHFFEYASGSTILITHFSDTGIYVPLETEFNFSNQNGLFDRMISTLKFTK